MSRTGDWIIEMMGRDEWEEDTPQCDYNPHEYATSQPEWASVFGQVIEFIYQVLQAEEMSMSARDLYHRAESLAVDVIAHKRDLSLNEAYLEMDCMIPKKPIEGIPF